MSTKASFDDKITHRIPKTPSAFGEILYCLLKEKVIKLERIRAHRAEVLATPVVRMRMVTTKTN